eukprot:1025194-Pyramimonas_sp.AAC.1
MAARETRAGALARWPSPPGPARGPAWGRRRSRWRRAAPGHRDGLALEVVPEGPIAQHLEEGVVIGVLAHVVQVVVLAAGADALLCVRRALQLREGAVGVSLAEEDSLELVHAGIGEEQGGVVVGHHGGRNHVRVSVRFHEEVHERLTHTRRGPSVHRLQGQRRGIVLQYLCALAHHALVLYHRRQGVNGLQPLKHAREGLHRLGIQNVRVKR